MSEDFISDIQGLFDDIDIDTCDISVLRYISGLMGEYPESEWEEQEKRDFVKNLGALIKLKGLHRNVSLRSLIKGDNVSLTENYKEEINEDRDYSRSETDTYPFLSARVEVLSCNAFCETLAETDVNYKTPNHGKTYIEGIGDVLPAHTKVKDTYRKEDLTGSVRTLSGYFACKGSCETVCEDSCEDEDEVDTVNNAYFEETVSSLSEDFTFSSTCVSNCETVCEDCCECYNFAVIPESYGEVSALGDGYIECKMYEILPNSELGGPDEYGASCTMPAQAMFGPCDTGCEVSDESDSVLMVESYLFYVRYIQLLAADAGYTYTKYRFYLDSEEDMTDKSEDFLGEDLGWEGRAVSWASNAVDCDGNPLTDDEREDVCTSGCEMSCVSYCEENCEEVVELCSGACETACTDACMNDCQSACQAGFSQVCEACETSDQGISDYLIVDGGDF